MSTMPYQPIRKPKVNRALAAAAGLSTLTLAVHVALGTPEVLAPVLASDATAVAREVTRACWHLISITLLAMAGSYAYGMRRRTPALILTWNLLAAAFGIVFVVVAITSGLGFDEVPQSIAFFVIAGVGFSGLNRSLYLPAEHADRHLGPATSARRAHSDPAQDSHRTAH